MQLCHAFPAALGRGRRGEPNKADGRSSEQTKTSQKVSARRRGRAGTQVGGACAAGTRGAPITHLSPLCSRASWAQNNNGSEGLRGVALAGVCCGSLSASAKPAHLKVLWAWSSAHAEMVSPRFHHHAVPRMLPSVRENGAGRARVLPRRPEADAFGAPEFSRVHQPGDLHRVEEFVGALRCYGAEAAFADCRCHEPAA